MIATLLACFLFAKACPECSVGKNEPPEAKIPEKIQVFMSFSVPTASWVDYSQRMEKEGGVFVIRGLPGNSIEQMIEKLAELRDAGATAPIDIDPESFERHQVTAVPTVVYLDSKIAGNIRLDEAIRLIEERQ